MRLSDHQISSFRANGYLVLPELFAVNEVRAMQEAADRVLELIVNSSFANNRTSGRLDLTESPEGRQSVRKIQPINDLSLTLAQASADERLVGPLGQLMDDQPVLMEEKLNYKQPLPEPLEGIETREPDTSFPVHSDWAYFKAQDYPQAILSSAICIDDCTATSGPIRVWPGSHTTDLEHVRTAIGLEVKPGLIDTGGGEPILAPAGSVLIFHSLLIHNSVDNTSGRPRRLMIYSHYPKRADMGFDVRNGPKRLVESAWEWEYQRLKESGKITDRFHAPVFA